MTDMDRAGGVERREREEREAMRAERDALAALMGDAIKCVTMVNANGYYDNWLVRARAALSRIDKSVKGG